MITLQRINILFLFIWAFLINKSFAKSSRLICDPKCEVIPTRYSTFPSPWAVHVVPRGGESSSETVITEEEQEKEQANDKKEELEAALQNNLTFAASKPGDGSENDPDGLPTRFLRMQKGDREKAKAAFAATFKWREEHDVNNILARPHPKFDLCKRIFPVFIPGRDLSNNLIVVQRPGMMNFDLAHKHNITTDDLLMHYVYVCEYCWNILQPGPPDGVMTTVMDLKGVSFSLFRDKDARDFLRKFVAMMSENYPQRSHKTLIINAPSWANMAYKIVKPLLRESTKEKISLHNGGAEQDRVLIEILGKDSVPKELLEDAKSTEEDTNGEANGGISQIEEELRSFCVSHNEKSGIKMQIV